MWVNEINFMILNYFCESRAFILVTTRNSNSQKYLISNDDDDESNTEN